MRRKSQDYKLKCTDELVGYQLLPKEITTIGVDMLIDKEEKYLKDEHVPLVFVDNTVDDNQLDYIPISIDSEPQILDRNIKINLNDKVLEDVITFIKINKYLLLQNANKLATTDNTFGEMIKRYLEYKEQIQQDQMR